MSASASEESVPLYGADGRPTGEVAPRSEVRRRNLRHAATAVIVRNRAGEVYVHRRTETKDVFPGRYDFAAGGVLAVGEQPLEAALRETAEELGVHGVDLVRLREADYRDEHTDYRAFCFSCTYDGPITWQPEEVAWGEWVSPGRLLDLLDELPFVPDTVALLRDVIEGWRQEA